MTSRVLARCRPAALLLALALAAPAQTIVVDNFNLGTTTGAPVAGTSWAGQTTAGATTVTVGGTATDVNGWAASGLSLNAGAMGYLRITARRDTGNTNPSVVFQFDDAALTQYAGIFSVPSTAFQSGAFTTVQIPIASWGDGFDPTQITGWSLGGGSGVGTAFRMTFDHIELSAGLLPLAGGRIVTAGDQIYTTAQTLTAATTLANTAGANLAGTAITFSSTLDGNHALVLETGGVTTFAGAVGGTTPLASLTTDAGGSTVVSGGLVRTHGSQTYHDSVTLGSDTIFRTLVDGALIFSAQLSGGGHAVTLDSAAGSGSLAGVTNVSSLTKSGAGSLSLTAASSYAGPTVVGGGTLALGVAQALPSASPLVLGGGRLALGGFAQTLASLQVTAASTIDFGAGAALTFGDSSALAWSAPVTITNYQSGLNALTFGASAAALTPTQLSLLRFADYGNSPGLISATGLVTPSAIPEPSVWAALAGAAAFVAALRRRKVTRGPRDFPP